MYAPVHVNDVSQPCFSDPPTTGVLKKNVMEESIPAPGNKSELRVEEVQIPTPRSRSIVF